MRHHTKDKGDLGVLKAKVAIYEQGYEILIPQTEHAPFDLVGYKDGIFYRFQVKYRKKDKTGWADKNGNHIKHYDKNDLCDYIVQIQIDVILYPWKF